MSFGYIKLLCFRFTNYKEKFKYFVLYTLLCEYFMPEQQPITMRTKSGTIIYMADNNAPKQEKLQALKYFVNVYNKSFSFEEQRMIGNVVYQYDKHSKNYLGKDVHNNNVTHAETKYVTKQSFIDKFNPRKKGMGIVIFSKDSYKDEFAIIHEMIHVKKHMQGVPFSKQLTKINEKKQDLETVGRISKTGFKNNISKLQTAINMEKHDIKRKSPVEIPTGYYFNNDVSNQKLVKSFSAKDKKKTLKLEEEQLNGMIRDRKLMTGSINTNVVGKVASSRAERLYPKSFFNQKKFNIKKK